MSARRERIRERLCRGVTISGFDGTWLRLEETPERDTLHVTISCADAAGQRMRMESMRLDSGGVEALHAATERYGGSNSLTVHTPPEDASALPSGAELHQPVVVIQDEEMPL